MTRWDDALHEARHVCGHWLLDHPVDAAAIGDASFEEGHVVAASLANGAGELLTRMLGWCEDADLPHDAIWPPPYPPPVGPGRDPDGVGWCVQTYRLSRECYEAVVQLAEELVADPDFQEATRLVARGLLAAPSLTREGLESLRAATMFRDLETAA